MPYSNVPESMWPKMDRCVLAVTKQGHSKQNAIAICYESLVGQKVLVTGVERIEKTGAQLGEKAKKPKPSKQAVAIAEKAGKKGVTPELVQSDFIDAWNQSVQGTPASDRLQKVAARTFGLQEPPEYKDLKINWKLLYPMGELYNITQAALEKRGYRRETTVPVYHPYIPSTAAPKQWKKGQEVRIKLSPLTSWTTNIQEASKFASFLASSSAPGLVLKTFIPVSSIISTPETGFGMKGTQELVLAGGEYEALVELRFQ